MQVVCVFHCVLVGGKAEYEPSVHKTEVRQKNGYWVVQVDEESVGVDSEDTSIDT